MKSFIKENKTKFDRIVDCVPAFLTITFLFLLIYISAVRPTWTAYFLTTYIIYYAYESIRVGVLSLNAYKKIKENRKIDWWNRLEKKYGKELDGFYQAILIPFASEPLSVLEPTVKNLTKSNFPKKKIILVLATESAKPTGLEISRQLKKKYGNEFGHFLITEHKLVEGEMKGKASNENYAGRELYKYVNEKGLNPKNIMVTSLDSDMKPDPQFLPMLTYKFFSEGKNRFKRIFQPLPINLEKAWGSITPARLVASFGFQYFSAQMQMPRKLINYSVYSASLHMIHAVGFWSPDIIPEDERFYWQSYFVYGTKLKVVPVFIPVYGDIIIGDSLWEAVKEQYKQIRRWAWGATEIKYFLYHMILDDSIPFADKLVKLLIRIRTHFEWVLIPVIISVGNFLPTWLNESYRKNPLAYMIPLFTSRILTVLLITFVLLIIMDNYYAPPKPEGWKKHKTYLSYLAWVMFPIVSFFFSAFPAFEAQFRMLINKPIVYIETKKK